MNLFRLLLLFLLLPGASSYAGGDARQEKMCWAHYVGWGFNQSDGYDKAALSPEWMLHPFNDRTLLGRDLQWDSGIFSAPGNKSMRPAPTVSTVSASTWSIRLPMCRPGRVSSAMRRGPRSRSRSASTG